MTMPQDKQAVAREWNHCGSLPWDGSRHVCVDSDTVDHTPIALGVRAGVQGLCDEHNAAIRELLARRAADPVRDKLVEALEVIAMQMAAKRLRYTRIASPWFEQMPGHWPIEFTLTMDQAREIERAALRLARGEP